jgi:hypothetical protein
MRRPDSDPNLPVSAPRRAVPSARSQSLVWLAFRSALGLLGAINDSLARLIGSFCSILAFGSRCLTFPVGQLGPPGGWGFRSFTMRVRVLIPKPFRDDRRVFGVLHRLRQQRFFIDADLHPEPSRIGTTDEEALRVTGLPKRLKVVVRRCRQRPRMLHAVPDFRLA